MKHLPNILTIARIILTVAFILLISRDGLLPLIYAAIVFAIASLTDYFDGYFAKKKDLVSNFGKIMDPIADKFLILVAFFVFVQMGIVPRWMFFLILLREVSVTGSRLRAMRRGRILAAEKAGKCKTASQIVSISVILIFAILQETSYSVYWADKTLFMWLLIIQILLIVTVALTLFSGATYFWNNRKMTYAQ